MSNREGGCGRHVWLVVAIWLCLGQHGVLAQESRDADPGKVATTKKATSGARSAHGKTLAAVAVQARSLGGGLMTQQDAPKQISTMTAQAISEQVGTSDYTQLMNSMPGVNAASEDGSGLTDAANYTIRGFSASEIGVTLDGVPVNDAGNYAPYTAEYGEARNYASISVTQGSADISFPDLGAVGGHIAFQTLAPTHDFNIYYGQTFGSYDMRSSYVRVNTGDWGPVSSWISVSRNSADLWRGGGYDHIDRLQGKTLWTINENNSIAFNYNLNREHNYNYEPLTKSQVNATGYSTSYGTTWAPTPAGGFAASDTYAVPASVTQMDYYRLYQNPFKALVASLDGEFKLTDALTLSVIPYYQYGDGNGSFGGYLPLSAGAGGKPVVQSDLYADGQYPVYEAYRPITHRPGITANFALSISDSQTLSWGFWYEHSRQLEYIDAEYVDPLTGMPESVWGDKHLLTYSNGKPWLNYSEFDRTTVEKAFVQDVWNPSDAWTISAGISYLYTQRDNQFEYYPGNPDPVDAGSYNQDTDNRYHKVLPTIGVSWQVSDANQLYYSLTRTFRAPVDASTFGNSSLGLPPPKAEGAWSNELGWRFNQGPLTLHTDLYLANMGNRTATGVNPSTYLDYYINAGPVRMAGLNMEGSLDLGHGYSLYSSYTYTQAKVKQDIAIPGVGSDGAADYSDATTYATAGKQFPGTPRNMMYLGGRYSGHGLTVNLNGKFTGSEYGDFIDSEKIASSFTVNAGISYQLPDFNDLHKTTISLNGLNLLDRRYLSLVSSPELSAAEASPAYFVGPPREWYLSFSTTFF
ncbi:TonB-dependent receptor [Frateuria aurantia]